MSSLAGVFMTSLLFFVIVSVCYKYKKKQKQGTPIHATNVIYEEISPRSPQEGPELNQNIAYGPIRSSML